MSLMVKIVKSNLMICNRVCLNIRDERRSFHCKQKEKNKNNKTQLLMCYKKHRLPAALVTPTGLLSHVHNDRW